MTVKIKTNGQCEIDGLNYPAVGFGTFPLKDAVCFQAVSEACHLGYRIIDTATYYQNFLPISEALLSSSLERKDLYVISKVWPNAQSADKLKDDLKTTLQELQIDYLDAYLIHWPNSHIPLEETLNAMDELRKAGKIRHIGLSNVTVNHMKRALELNIPITWVQVEMHPHFYDAELLKFCHEHSIGMQAWSPLSRGAISNDTFLKKLSEKYHKTTSQIALKWILQHQCIPLPGSKNPAHMEQNLQVNDFTLTDEEMKTINARAIQGLRKRITPDSGLDFGDEFDFTYQQCWPKI